MYLVFDWFDGRSATDRNVKDLDQDGKVVGFIAAGRQTPGIFIRLFAGKFSATVATYEECCGFVEGVEAVLRHMTTCDEDDVSRSFNRFGPKPQYYKPQPLP